MYITGKTDIINDKMQYYFVSKQKIMWEVNNKH